MKRISDTSGDVYYLKEEMTEALKHYFQIFLNEEELENTLENLATEQKIVILKDHYYLKENYEREHDITKNLEMISNLPKKDLGDFDKRINNLEKTFNVAYNSDQKRP